jgi:hypothetical protein
MPSVPQAKKALLTAVAVLVGSLLCLRDASALYVTLHPHAEGLQGYASLVFKLAVQSAMGRTP